MKQAAAARRCGNSGIATAPLALALSSPPPPCDPPPLPPAASAVDPAVVRRMCHKIAQLTKVVYAVNLQNARYAGATQRIVDAYESEIMLIETNAAKRLEAELGSAAERHRNALCCALETAEGSQSLYRHELECAKNAASEAADLMMRKHTEQLAALKSDLGAVQSELNSARECTVALDRKLKVADGAVSSYSDKCKEYVQKLDAANQAVIELDEQVKRLESGFTAERGDWEQLRVHLLSESNNQQGEISSLASVIVERNSEIEKLKLSVSQHQEALKAAQDAQTELKTECSAHIGKIEQLTRQLETATSETQARERDIQMLRSETEKRIEACTVNWNTERAALQGKFDAAQKQTSDEKVAGAHRVKEKEAELARIREKLLSVDEKHRAELNEQSKRASREREDAVLRADADAKTRIAAIQADCERLKCRNDDLLRVFQIERETLERKFKLKVSEITDLSNKFIAHEKESKAMVKESDAEIHLLKNQIQQVIQDKADAESSFQKALADSEHGFTLKLVEAKKESDKMLAQAAKESQATLNSLHAELRACRELREQEGKEYQEKCSRLVNEISSLCASDSERVEALRKSRDDAAALNKRLSQLTNELESARQDTFAAQAETLNEKAAFARKEFELREAVNKSVIVIKSLESDLENLRFERAKAFDSAMSMNLKLMDAQKSLELISLERDDGAKILESKSENIAQLESERQRLIVEVNELHQELAMCRRSASDVAESTRVELECERRLFSELQHSLTSLQELHKTAEKTHKTAIETQTARAVCAETELEKATQSALHERKASEEKAASIQKSHQKALARLEEEHEKTIRALRTDIESERRNSIDDRDRSERISASLIEQERSFSLRLADYEKRISEACRARDSDLAAAKAKSDGEIAALHRHYGSEIEVERGLAREELEKMLGEFASAKDYMSSKISDLEKCVHEWEIRYANREPRNVDVVKIRALDEEIERLGKRVSHLMDELRATRSEIVSREESLNRVFGSRPVVVGAHESAAARAKAGGRVRNSGSPLSSVSSSTLASTTQLPALAARAGHHHHATRPSSGSSSSPRNPSRLQ